MYEELIATLRESRDKRMLDAADAIEEQEREIAKRTDFIAHCGGEAGIRQLVVNSEEAYRELVELNAKVPRWISVEERLPEKYQYAVCWVNDEENKRGFYGIGSLSKIGDWYVDGDDYSENGNLHVTHWMPLPQPPKEET